jgi:GR25 family glycosyltransferase involved in LPS biosynthesis
MNNVGHIFYINLDKRTDRRNEIENELENRGLIAERFPAIEVAPPMGILGCGKSHLQVLKIAKERGYPNVLILEDDFVFLVDRDILDKNIQTLFEFADSNIVDVCFLAYNLVQSEPVPENNDLIRVKYSTTASAYIVNAHYYDKFIHLYEEAMPLLEQTQQHWIYANDQVWRTLQEKDHWYCFSTRIGKQREGFSDNSQRYVSYEC